MRKLLCVLLAFVLLSVYTSVLSEDVASSFSIRVVPVRENLDFADPRLLAGLSELCDVLTLSGSFYGSDDPEHCFDASLRFVLSSGEELAFDITGSDSKWIVTSPLLAEERFLFDLDALCEFAIKAYNHLELPLQIPALMIPYTHLSGTKAVRDCFCGLVPDADGTYFFTAESLIPLCERLSAVMQTDRAFTYWLMCIGIRSGFDSIILEEADSLREALPEVFTVTRSGGRITDVCSEDMVYYHSENGNTYLLIPETPVYGYRICASWENDPFVLSVNIHSDISDETALSLSVENVLDQWLVNADGTMLHTPLHFGLTYDGHGTYTLTDAVKKTLAMITVDQISPAVSSSHLTPVRISADMINVFSLNDSTLAALSDKLIVPALRELIPFVAAIPSSTCQCLMDLLTDSGILTMLFTGSGSLDE